MWLLVGGKAPDKGAHDIGNEPRIVVPWVLTRAPWALAYVTRLEDLPNTMDTDFLHELKWRSYPGPHLCPRL